MCKSQTVLSMLITFLAFNKISAQDKKEFNYYIMTYVNWETAKQICSIQGGLLADLETVEELNLAWSGAPILWYYWTSGSDGEPGNFTWANGQLVNSTLWADGEPNSFGTGVKACVYMYNGQLYDAPCTFGYNVVCQMIL